MYEVIANLISLSLCVVINYLSYVYVYYMCFMLLLVGVIGFVGFIIPPPQPRQQQRQRRQRQRRRLSTCHKWCACVSRRGCKVKAAWLESRVRITMERCQCNFCYFVVWGARTTTEHQIEVNTKICTWTYILLYCKLSYLQWMFTNVYT